MNTSWPIAEEDIDNYSAGYCPELALALYQQGAGDIVVFFGTEEWIHVAIKTEDGDALDVSGLKDFDEALEYWEANSHIKISGSNFDEVKRNLEEKIESSVEISSNHDEAAQEVLRAIGM